MTSKLSHASPFVLARRPPPTSAHHWPARRPLSAELWDLDWAEFLPRKLTEDGVSVEASDLETVAPFIERHYPAIFQQDMRPSRFRSGGTPALRRRYYAAVGDFFAFRHHGEIVAVLIGTPVDWATYYIRSAAALREYQGRGLVQRLFPLLFERLKAAGVERIEAEASPGNFASVQHLLRHRFQVTGTVLSDRWGALVRLTRFLDDGAADVFEEQFCDGVSYGRRG